VKDKKKEEEKKWYEWELFKGRMKINKISLSESECLRH